MEKYDEPRLVAALSRLPQKLRAAFSAACAERLVPAYRRFSERSGRGDAKTLTSILETLWDDLREHEPMGEDALSAAADACMALIPDEDDEPAFEEQAEAEDCASALAYAIDCRRSGDAQEAAWAARRVYEAVDHFAINSEHIRMDTSGAEQRVLEHPLVQAELVRQRQDLDELLATPKNDETASILRLRDRARSNAAIVFSR